ncbi:MAG: agmatine deiminase family protein [Lysobacteraceae bacterium]
MTDPLRFPAEWETQAAILLAWPHRDTDWAERLEAVEACYARIAAAITDRQGLLLCVPDAAIHARAQRILDAAGARGERIRWIEVPYDDTWLRDSGPISLRRADGGFHLLDFRFTGWGGKFEASRDDALVGLLHEKKQFLNSSLQTIDFALEGGAIETDGEGTLLTTWRCLGERHPDKSRSQIESVLRQTLHQDRILGLQHGYLEGDDTDAHIDTLARFAATDAIVFQSCDDPRDVHHGPLGAMAQELAALRTRDGQPYRLFPLPWPQPILDGPRRLAASYANFLIINGALLMPAYDDPADTAAAAVLAAAFPEREIIALPCRDLIWQNGSLHCLSMQLPEGLVDV